MTRPSFTNDSLPPQYARPRAVVAGEPRRGRQRGPDAGLAWRCLVNPDPHVEPRRLAGHRVRVRDPPLELALRQVLADQMIEEETVGGLGCVRRESPRAALLTDPVPGPHGVRLDAFHRLQLAAHAPAPRFDPYPVAVGEPELARRTGVHVQVVLREELPQPDVLRIPRVVHDHRPLGERVQRVAVGIDPRLFERLVPDRQRVEVSRQPFAILGALRLRAFVETEPSEPELRERLGPELHDHRLDLAEEARRNGLLLVAAVREAVILLAVAPVMGEERAVLDVALPLIGIRFAV